MIKNVGVFKDFDDGTLKSVFEGENKRIIEMSLLAINSNKATTVFILLRKK